ncbi:MAG TPA: GNAT family N-acetyltransferase [Acidimicrobiales bacterium]|nr:GNAT family N-acetyltransferase [Acidimicrobiales bacterium]
MLPTTRPRSDADLAALEAILEESAADGYPPHRPAGRNGFLASAAERWARVAEADGVVMGHVALNDHSARSVMDLASASTGLDASALVAVARLFVSRSLRRAGLGGTLLEDARAEAQGMGRLAVLDVWVELAGTVAFYDAMGWHRLGEVSIEFRSPCSPRCVHEGSSIRSLVYASPT